MTITYWLFICNYEYSQIQKCHTLKACSGINTYAQSFGLFLSPTTTNFHPFRRLKEIRASVGRFIVVVTIHLLCLATSRDARVLTGTAMVSCTKMVICIRLYTVGLLSYLQYTVMLFLNTHICIKFLSLKLLKLHCF